MRFTNRYTFRRLLNLMRCAASYLLSLTGRVVVRHMPTFVSVEPSNRCQLRCPECPVGMRGGHALDDTQDAYLSLSLYERILLQTAPYAHTMQFYLQGEPLLNKQLPEMIHLAHQQGLYTIVSTNAQALDDAMADRLVSAGLDRIIVSIDGLKPESYQSYRVGGDLERAKQALVSLRQAKQRHRARILIEWQCLKLRTNEHEWAEMRRVYRRWGADLLTLKSAQLYDYEHGHPLMPSHPRDSRYRLGKDGLYHLHRHRLGCWRLWSGIVFTTSGEALPCCYDKGQQYPLGNIQKEPLSAIYRSPAALRFRQDVLAHRPAICANCIP